MQGKECRAYQTFSLDAWQQEMLPSVLESKFLTERQQFF
jgi:hypothetical protein